LEGLWPEYAPVLLPALRHLACIHLYEKSFTVHTDITLANLENHITEYGKLTKVSLVISRYQYVFSNSLARSFMTQMSGSHFYGISTTRSIILWILSEGKDLPTTTKLGEEKAYTHKLRQITSVVAISRGLLIHR
jgi:hypothetical protein